MSTTSATHTPHTESCTIRFATDSDMDRAFDYLIYESDSDFAGVDEMTITVTKEQCEKLHDAGNITFDHEINQQ